MLRRSISLVLLLCLAHIDLMALAQSTPTAPGLRPGDIIRVEVYREKEISGEFLIDENGTVTLPIIGDQRVVGMPVGEVRTRLVAAFREQIRNPSIIITPLRRINVLGEVQKPGLYTVDPTVSLAGVIALAGGATGDGDLKRIRIVRDGTITRDRIGAAETLSTEDVRSGDEIFVEQRSWLARNTGLVISALLAVPSVISTIIIISRG